MSALQFQPATLFYLIHIISALAVKLNPVLITDFQHFIHVRLCKTVGCDILCSTKEEQSEGHQTGAENDLLCSLQKPDPTTAGQTDNR